MLAATPSTTTLGSPPNLDTELTPTVHVRLHMEHMLVDRAEGARARFEEELTPVLDLSFEYSGVRVRASDERDRVFVSTAEGLRPIDRNRSYENRARYLLESFGAVELGCLHTHEPAFDSEADYLVQATTSISGYCTFTAQAIPQLREHGFQIEIARDYPYQTVQGELTWYGKLEPVSVGACNDWLNLELGVEVEGHRINLLGALLALLQKAPRSASLSGVLAAQQIALPIAENKYLCVARAQLGLVFDVLRDLYTGALSHDPQIAAAPPPLRREQCADLARLKAAFKQQNKRLRFDDPILELGERLLSRVPQSIPQGSLRATLRPYQLEGLSWLQLLAANDVNGILADDMGLGKTLQTIAHIAAERDAGRLRLPTLIVAPTSLVGNWQKELARFAPTLRVRVVHGAQRKAAFSRMQDAHVVITTYPILLRDQARFERQNYHLVVLDEAQAIKNASSRAHRAVRALNAKHRLCLTGTPIENNLGELWALFDFLMPDFLGSRQQFTAQFRTPIEREANQDKLAALRARVAPFILRRMKDRVASELPSKTQLLRPVELGSEQRDLYESIRVSAHAEVRAAIRQKGLLGSTVTILDALMKLRQVCCDPRLVQVNSAARVRQSAKYDLLMQLIEEQLSQGHRILVFSQFTSMLSLIEQGVCEKGIVPLVLTGATQRRQELIDRFEAGYSDLFLISLKAGGTGLNLTSADTVIHYDPWWNPAAQAQATDRAYRIGQKKPVFVHNLIVSGSVEERMLQLQQHKQQLASGLLSDGGVGAPQWSEQQVHQLFAPLQGS
ncbi:MAG TPA: DEAD/DEAH box helicase [Polyangiaceae bacterium]|nr:DEAD/DEAH box helicase [Polyangiaceae bacterium]